MGPDERSRPGQATPRSGRASAAVWAMLVWAMAPAALLVGAGCNSKLVFSDRPRIPVVGDSGTMGNGDAAPDSPRPNDGGGDDLGSPDVPVDAPADTAIDTPPDRPPDVPPDTPPDVPKTDVQPDLPRDTGPDLPRDTGVDAGGPIVCTTGAQCVLASLRCLIVGGQPGQCVECVADTDCPGRHCETTLHRCVECVVAGTCPTSDDSHPSQCTDNHCQNGCDDSSPVCPNPPGFTCQDVAGNNICVDCLSGTTCPANKGLCLHNLCTGCDPAVPSTCPSATAPFCDLITGSCIQCRTSADCKMQGLRICDPMLLRCVPSP